MQHHPVVPHEDWIAARKALLAKEKQLTRLQDELNAERRALPWERVTKTYSFDTPSGPRTLAELFDGRSQLFVQHFMFAPGWGAGCVGCSFFADHIDGADQHLRHHDLTFVAVSRAPLAEITAYKRRMGWRFDWVSSGNSDFNQDFGVSFTKDQLARGVEYNYGPNSNVGEEMPGISVFVKGEDGVIHHSYSAYGRGDERGLGTYMFLDLTPRGRDETGAGNLTDWVRRHDEYGEAAKPAGHAAAS